jgi:Uma2 family endonuclease
MASTAALISRSGYERRRTKRRRPPDLAIEIVSDPDRAKDLDSKIHLYLDNGAKAVWVVWPAARRMDIRARE